MGRIWVGKSTFAELPAPAVAGDEFAVAATAEEFVEANDFVAPDSGALEVEGAGVPALEWAHP
jgi:hypothetical protein